MSNSITTTNNTKKSRQGHNHKNHKLIENRDFRMDASGAIIFESLVSAAELPAGEYLPAKDRQGNGILIPVNRRSSTEASQSITQTGGELEIIHTNGDEGLEMTDEDFADLERALMDDYEPKRAPVKENHNGFVPVHSYFPMENYSKGLRTAKENINRFLQSEAVYKELKMDYRRAILLYGDPGTGKSQFIYQLSHELIENRGAIVTRIENSRSLDTFFEYLVNPLSKYTGRMKVVVIEELADLCSSRNNITMLLTLLDSMIFRDNVLFLITTNHPDRIPSNIVDRPSRLDLLCPIHSRDLDHKFMDGWFKFCMNREITNEERQQAWYNETKGELSPAYLKELFIYSRLHDITLDEAWQVIKERRDEITRDFRERNGGIGFGL